MTNLHDIQNLNVLENWENNKPPTVHLTIHGLRSWPPLVFDVYSNSEIDNIRESNGISCLAKPKPQSTELYRTTINGLDLVSNRTNSILTIAQKTSI